MQQATTIQPSTEKLSLRWLTRYGRTIAAAITIMLWASAFAGIRAGLRDYAPTSVALLRYLTASTVLAIYALVTRMPLPRRRDLPGIIATGLLGFSIYNVALNAGEQNIPAGVASFIVASAPIYTALIALWWFQEKLNGRGWLGILISFGGVSIIALAGQTGALQLDWHALLVLLAAVVQATYFVSQKPLLKIYGPLRFTTYAIWSGTAFLLFFLPTLLHDARHASAGSTLAIIYMGIFPGAVAYVCWSIVLAKFPAPVAGSFLYCVPPVASLIAWVWLGETPGLVLLMGGALVVVGVFLVNTRRRV